MRRAALPVVGLSITLIWSIMYTNCAMRRIRCVVTKEESIRDKRNLHEVTEYINDKPKLSTPKIYYLDTSTQWDDIPHCDLENPVSQANMVKQKAAERFKHYELHHSFDQHDGPWFVSQALAASGFITNNISQASLIYIDSFCYFTWYWWSRYLTIDQKATLNIDPEQIFLKVLERLPEVADPNKSVFYFPAPYNAGCASQLAKGFMIVCELSASCTPKERSMVAPYNSNFGIKLSSQNIRSTFVTFIGGSSGDQSRSTGQNLRMAVNQALQNKPDTMIRGSCLSCHNELSHDTLIDIYKSSKFCLVLPGDTQSSRRATEVIVNGCIPVFVGPPFNSAPFSVVIDYRNFAFGVRIRNTDAWVRNENHKWEMQNWKQEFEAQIVINQVEDLYSALKNISTADVERRQGFLQLVQDAFIFKSRLDPVSPSASDLIINHMLSWAVP